MSAGMCPPTDHHFEHGGEGDLEEWEAWLFCSKCGATAMIPLDAEKPTVITAPQVKSPEA
jgi:hypothetical protein